MAKSPAAVSCLSLIRVRDAKRHQADRDAVGRLAVKGATISYVAASLGYESDSAFGAAFKRILGASPGKISRPASDQWIQDP